MSSRALAVQSHQLSVIGPIVDDYLAAPHGMKIVRKVAGFEVEEEVATTTEWRDGERRYRDNARDLQQRLAARDVQPIAIMPRSWWNQIVKDHGFYDMQPDEQGRIKMATRNYAKEARIDGYEPLVVISVMVAAFYTLGWQYVVGEAISDPAGRFITHWGCACAAAVVAAFVLCVVCEVIFKKAKDRLLAILGANLFLATRGRHRIVSDMIAYGDSQRRNSHEVVMAMVTLPTPPDDVMATLMKLSGIDNVRVSADPSTVSFSPSPAQVIAGAILEQRFEEEERRQRLAADPIVYVVEGNAIAIVAQFGDCPIEKAAIEAAVRSQTSF